MCAQRFGAPDVEKGFYRVNKYFEAIEKAEVRACGGNQGPQKTRGVPLSEVELLVPHPHGRTYQDARLRDGEVEGS